MKITVFIIAAATAAFVGVAIKLTFGMLRELERTIEMARRQVLLKRTGPLRMGRQKSRSRQPRAKRYPDQ